MSGVTLDDLDALDRELGAAGLNGVAHAEAEVDDEWEEDAERAAIRAEPADPNPWGDLFPFGSYRLPSFPVDALSEWMASWVAAEAVAAQVPPDLAACLALASASLGVARIFHVQVRPGWREPCNTWIAVAMPPGERKSSVYADATRPIYAYVEYESERLGPLIASTAFDRQVLEGQIKDAAAAAVKGKTIGGIDARVAARDLRERLDKLDDVRAPVLLTDDCTAEALAVLMSHHGERIGVFSAEGGPLELMAGRYSDRGANFEIYLKAHPGDPHLVNRISREPISLRHPLLTMALTVQPHVIAALSDKDGFRGRGLLARFLFSLPQSAVGSRASDTDPVPEDVAAAYNAALVRILTTPGQRTVTMHPDADAARSRFQSELEPRLGPDGDLHHIADWANKLVGGVARLAGVLHVADHAHALDGLPELPAATWARAETIGRYFLAHALAAFDAMGQDEHNELARRIWTWVARGRRQSFTAAAARRATHATPEAIALAIPVLVDRALVRPGPTPRSSGGRTTSQGYEVNPRSLMGT